MKKYFSMLPIYNLIISLIVIIVFNIIGIAVIPLIAIMIYGGITILGIIVATFENIKDIKNIKQIILKIFINFLITLLVYTIVLVVLFEINDYLQSIIIALQLTLETVVAYGIILIIKYKKMINKWRISRDIRIWCV